jgi:hypothetical protein
MDMRALRCLAVLLAVASLAGCAANAPSRSAEVEAGDDYRGDSGCGNLPPPFSPPIACLRIEEHASGCFTIEREPGPGGGLRIPRQIVCSFAR